jgi:hypothetical protein
MYNRYEELLNEVLQFLSERKMDLMPPKMKDVLSQLVLVNCAHRSFMSKVLIQRCSLLSIITTK